MKYFSRIVCVLALLTLVGCATQGSRLGRMDLPRLERELNLAVDTYLRQTLTVCRDAHVLYVGGESLVDCKWSTNLEAMLLSLPDTLYYDQFQAEIGRWRQNWCASSLAKTGVEETFWVVRYRDTGHVSQELCWPQEEDG